MIKTLTLKLLITLLVLPSLAFALDENKFTTDLNNVPEFELGTKITFKVNVELPACTVDVGLPQIKQGALDLGTISSAEGSVGHRMPLSFRFRDCTNITAIKSIVYERDSGNYPNSTPGDQKSGFISTSDPKVRLYLFKNSFGNEMFDGKEFTQGLTFTENDLITACYIEPQVISGQGKASVGQYQARAFFKITYM